MCGIFGIISNDTHHLSANVIKTLTESLLIKSSSRGKDAAGISLWDGSSFHITKAPVIGTEFPKQYTWNTLKEKIPNQSHFSVIGHTRLATNGTPKDNRNNQPLTGKYCIGVHNGVIVNSTKIVTRFRQKVKTQVDTESIICAFDHFSDIGNSPVVSLQKTFKLIDGAASVALQCVHKPVVLLATNTGSLYISTNPNYPLIFTSEERILLQCLKQMHQPHNKNAAQHIHAGEYVSIDCITGTKTTGMLAETSVETTHSRIGNSRYPIHLIEKNDKTISSVVRLNHLRSLKRHQPDYKKIYELRRCTKCILPETMPLITFDQNGVCNYCNTYKWEKPLGLHSFQEILEPFRSKDGKPDCILAFSGGRDSAYGLHLAKKILNLNPVAYTYDWGMVTDTARRNQSRLTAALGVEHIIVAADLKQKRLNIKKNILAWLRKPDLGMVTLFMAGDKQAEFYAEQLSKDMNIPLVLYCRGNHLEDERFKFGYFNIFDGTPGGVIHNLSFSGKLKMFNYAVKQYVQNPAYINISMIDTTFAFFSTYLMHHKFIYLWKYLPWEETTVVNTLKQEYGWETPKDTVATWRIDDGSPPFYNYIYYHTQGFTENDAFRSNQIREGILTRTTALNLAHEENKPRYEGLQWYFDTLELDGDTVLTQIDRIPALF